MVFSTSNTLEIEWIHCNPGQAPSAVDACSPCDEGDCLFCPTGDDDSFDQICQFCDPDSESCSVDETCPDDLYRGNAVCKRCRPGCRRCTDWDDCTSCDSGRTMGVTAEGYEFCFCPSDEFGTLNYDTDTLVCADCDPGCLTCNNTATTCTSCASPDYLQNQGCVNDCTVAVSNSWPSLPDRICRLCVSDCDACTSLDCGTCAPGFKYHNGNCVATCPPDAVEETPGTCTDCEDGCATCSTTHDNCDSCDSFHHLYMNSCDDDCPGDMYSNTDRECTACPAECTSCASDSYCYSCDPLYYFVKNSCKLTCVTGYYPEDGVPGYKFCRECPSTCKECTDVDTCTQCKAGSYLHTETVDVGPPVRQIISCLTDCKPFTFANDLT